MSRCGFEGRTQNRGKYQSHICFDKDSLPLECVPVGHEFNKGLGNTTYIRKETISTGLLERYDMSNIDGRGDLQDLLRIYGIKNIGGHITNLVIQVEEGVNRVSE